ncbi:uncharacterized protein [Periplaneta americana]|uniref:uncharacterized protein n=1 Tax=Periplaneta americana TaxID=6978 RepID=UPI0037E8D3CB
MNATQENQESSRAFALVREDPVSKKIYLALKRLMGSALISVLQVLALVTVNLWIMVEMLLNVVSGPIQTIVNLVTAPYTLAILCILAEIFLEVATNMILAGVSLAISAILLLEEAFSRSKEGSGDDECTKVVTKKPRCKTSLPCCDLFGSAECDILS